MPRRSDFRRSDLDSDVPHLSDRTRPRPRRRYRLSPDGLAALRESAQRVRPWERSTGPRTAVGKRRSRANALRHGERSVYGTAVSVYLGALSRALRADGWQP